MSGDTWDFISTQIKKNIQNERSILSQFPLEAASITAREIVLSLSADCSCKKAVAVAAANATAEPIPASAPASTKRPLGRHGNPSSAVGETKAELPAATDARLKRFTVNLNADTDLQWVMQIINYGLMMPPEHWDIVEHCVHLYCEWLGCLLPAADQKPNLPHALLTYPVVYAKRILFSLCRFFAHRGSQDFPSTGGDGTEVFQLMHEPPREPPDSGCAESVEEIFKSASASVPQPTASLQAPQALDDERWLQTKYLPLASLVVSRVEQILYSSHLLTTTFWDSLLQFALATCHAVLSLPPPVGYDVITASRPFSQDPGVRGLLQLECLVIGMLMRVWMRALSLHYPSPGYWQGLAELCLIARHRVGLGYVWSRVVVIFTYNLLRPHIADCLLRPVKQAPREGSLHRLNLPQFTAYQPLINRHLMVDLPRDVANASWFRFLHLFGNPTDLCHPSLITHTATFEYFRRLNGVARCRLTASFLPAIFHQALRSISTIVDLFIGIAPSLSGCLFTFVGIPPNLYGPIDITEYFKYTSVRAPDTIFVDKQNAGCEALGASSAASEPPESAPPPASAVNSSGSMVRTVGHSSALVNPQTLVEEWLRPDAFVTAFYNRPEAASLLQLLGPWLFEAAVNGTSLAKATDNAAASVKEGAVSRERASTVDNFSFHVGRAEAVACLCRIFIYARRTQIALILLARFYACLVRALTVEPEVEYVLSTVLLHAPDLLRANLEASSVLVPTIFNACQWVLRKNSVVCPDYVSMVLLRRACLHQLLSMVCLPSQFDGIQFRDISSPTTSDAGALSARALRTKLAGLLCDLLTYETDTHNLRMILSGGFALVLDMISVESSPSKGTYQKSLSSTADAASSLETASGLYGALLDKISMSWRRWMNDFPLSLFALDVLIGLANAPVPKPSIAHCRRCIQSICAFIESQCKREKKDHTRALHSLIINAFQCLSVWLVAHPPALMEYETLRAVVETIKLGIFGAEATSTSASQTSESRSSLPLPSAMPFSKRVSEAAEHLLSTLFSSVGTFPQASGPETLSSHLTEDHLAKVSCASNFRHFLTPSDLVLSVSESVPSSGNESDHQDGCRRVADPSPVLTFLRDDSGRHLWSWKLRYEPKKVARGSNETSAQTTLRSKTIRPLRSCLENIVSTKRPVGSESLFLPKTREKIPLVKSEKVMPTLAQVVVGSSARKEVDALKSLIASEAQKCEELGQRVRETRLKACRGVTCRPERMMKNFPSGHILASNLGYIPVNNLSASSSSFRATNSSSQLQQQQQQQTIDVPLSNSKPRRPSARIPGTKGVGSNVEISSIIPSSLIPLPPSMATKIDSSLFTNPRSTSTLFVFYVTEGQTSLNDVIANMNSWSSTPKVFQSFMCSLGWVVDCTRHPGWKGSVKRSRGNLNAPHPAESGYHGSTPSGASVDWRRNPPDGIDSLFYWADASTEVVSLCPSWRTKVAEKSTDDFRAGVLWLEAWDDALWMPPSGEPNPLQAALASQFGCGLVILIHPLTNNGLFRIGLIQQHHIEHQVGPLTTGLVLSAALLGSMVRSTVVNAAHRLAADSGDLSNGLSRKVLATIENKQFASAVELLLWSSERCY